MRVSGVLLSTVVAVCAWVAEPLPAQTLRVAWFTDTHVGSATGAEDLRAAVDDVNSQPDIQCVLVTGDITEFGSDAQLEAAREILGTLARPVYVIPGNHDTKWSESGGRTFGRLFGAERFAFTAGDLLFICMHQGPRMRMADGFWAPEDVRWLDSLLASIPDPDQPLVFVTHYPIDSGIANWYEVLDRLKERNVQAILAGHGHRNRIEDYEGLPGVMGRSTLRGREERGGYTILWRERDSILFAERRPGSSGLRRWHSLAVHRTPVRTQVGAWPRPSFAVNEHFPDVRVVWTYDAGHTLAAACAAEGDRVFFGAGDGQIHAVEARTGRLLWKKKTGGPIYSPPAAAKGVVVIGSTDSTIRCLRQADGEEVWRLRTEGAVLGAPAITDGKVFIGASDRVMRGIDLKSGEVLWTSEKCGGFIEAKPLWHDGTLYFGAWDGKFYALDARDGRERWHWEGEKGILLSPAACWPVAGAGKIFIVAPDRRLTALEGKTGEVLWRSARHQVRETIGGSVGGERIYVRLMRDTIMAFSSVAPGPSVQWATDCGFGYDMNGAMLTEWGGTLFYGSKDGEILALEGATGRILWRQRVAVGPLNTLTPLTHHRVIASGFDGKVRCVEGP